MYSLGLIQEELDDVVSAFGMVKEDKQRPVNEPRPLLQWLKRWTHRLKDKSIVLLSQVYIPDYLRFHSSHISAVQNNGTNKSVYIHF